MTDRLYQRISRDSATSGAIDKQDEQLLRRADPADHVVYTERSVSAAKVMFADRPEGGRLLADLRTGDRVLVTRIDRAARNTRDLLALVEMVEGRGATVVFTEQDINTAGPMGRFLLTLLGAVAELESETVAERVRETRASFVTQGRWGGGPVPYGLTPVPNPNGRGQVLRPDPVYAPHAREVVARVLAGVPQRQIAPTMARIPFVGLGEPGLSSWLRNPAIAGIRPGADPELDPDAALIKPSEWVALKAHLDRPVKAWSRSETYAEALTCGVCGDRLYYAKSKHSPQSSVYRCARRKHADGDPAVSVTRRNADVYIEDDFLARVGPEPVLEEVTVSTSDARDEAIARAQLRLEAAQRAQREARDRDSRRAAGEAVDAALDALDDAEAMPDETVVETRDTGMTHAELWEALPPGERAAFITSAGRWSVAPGRGLPVAEKVRYVD